MKKLTAFISLFIGAFTAISISAFGSAYLFQVMEKGYHFALGSVTILAVILIAILACFVGFWIDDNIT